MFTKSFEVGVLLCLRLAESKKPLLASELIKSLNVSLDFAHQILFKLKKQKIISSLRGAKGGILLAKDPKDITLLDILFALEPKSLSLKCSSRMIFSNCQMDLDCKLRKIFERINNIITHELNVSLDTLKTQDVTRIHPRTSP